MSNPHARQPLSPLAMVRSVVDNRALILRMAKREILARYKGSFIGLFWVLINPIIMLTVYTFVFSVVFNARWGTVDPDARGQFAVILYAGLLMHGLFAEVLNAAPNLVMANANYVKKVVFPLEILPVVSLCVALFQCLIGVGVLVCAHLLFMGSVPVTAPLIVLVLVPLSLFTLGLAWFIAALGVYLRDVAQVTLVFTMVALFVSPVFFPVEVIPQPYQNWMYYNPLTFLIEQARDVTVWEVGPDPLPLLLCTLLAFGVASLGFAWFQAVRKGFADVL